MATIEKDCLLVTKAGDNLIINYPYTKAQNVDGIIKTVNGIAPNSNGEVTITLPPDLTTRVETLENKSRLITSTAYNTMAVDGAITSTGNITSKQFNGALNGNANTATKATQDGDGNVITATYAVKAEIPTKVSQLENDSGYLTEFSEIYVNAINKNTQDITGLKSTVSSLAPITMVQGVSTRVAVIENKTNNMSFSNNKTTFSGTVQGTFIGSLEGTASNADKLNNVSASLYALKSDIPDVSSLLSKIFVLESKVTALESKLASYEGAQGIMWK